MGQVENVSVETDPAFDRALKAAVQRGGSDPDAVFNALVEELGITGGTVNFTVSGLNNASVGRQSLNVLFLPGADPTAAANNAAVGWLPTLRSLSGNGGEYSSRVSLVEVNGGCIVAIEVTVEQPAEEDEPAPVTLTGISVSGCKTEYFVGQSFDPTGMTVTATYSDNSTKTITGITETDKKDVSWDTEKFTNAGTKMVTISYGGKTATVTVMVKESEVEKIEVTTQPNKTDYNIDDTFNPTGMVITATYSDNVKTERIDKDYENQGVTWEPKTIADGTEQVTISYKSKTATVNIQVTLPTVTSIQVTWSDRETYYTDERIKKSDVVKSVTADYSYGNDPTLGLNDYQLTIKPEGGSTIEITDDNPYTFPSTGTYTFTVTYGGKHQEKIVKVQDGGYTVDGNTYTVYTASGLQAWNQAVQNNMSTNCTLAADIDMKGKEWTLIGVAYKGYLGTFDGDGHTITGLTVSQTGTYNGAGLINFLGSGGTVKNVKLENVNITGDYYVGGVVGWNYFGGTVTACSVSGSVTGNYAVGGVVGNNYGTVTACYYTDGNITGTVSWIGGVVGRNQDTGIVTACYHAGGTVSGDYHIGGVVGWNDQGTVRACYWSGNVKNGFGIGFDGPDGDNTKPSNNNATQVDGINVTPKTAVDGMNVALTGNDYQWALGTDGLPVLQKKQ